uniref:Uncharacterized protein n=1 Tax=Knipowitschia caucasica TaxID=637954 RepID=A0AAV2JDB6_KNICA
MFTSEGRIGAVMFTNPARPEGNILLFPWVAQVDHSRRSRPKGRGCFWS